MIAPRASNAFVCLRCELRSIHPRSHRVRSPRHLSSSSISAVYRQDRPIHKLEPEPSDEHSRDAFDEHFDDVARKQPAPDAPEAPHNVPVTEAEEQLPQPRVRRRRGKTDLKEEEVKLSGLKTMGKDSGILVLREIRQDKEALAEARRKAAAKLAKEKEEALRLQELLPQEGLTKVFEEEGLPLEQEEVNKQLESLCPKTQTILGEEQYITKTEFEKLQKKVARAFTALQLAEYLAYAKNERAKRRKELEKQEGGSANTKGKRILGRTKWYPGYSPLAKRLPGPGTGVITRGKKRQALNKTEFADQIMREAWGLVLLEEVESPGELEMVLKHWQIQLLNAGSEETGLDKVGEARKAKIEISWPATIRITAPKSNAEWAANDIEQLLQNTVSYKFLLEPWTRMLDPAKVQGGKLVGVFPRHFEQTVGRLSGTIIQTVADHTVQIRALKKSDAEEAQRLLITMLPLKEPTKITYEVSALEEQSSNATFVPVPFRSPLPLVSRQLPLGRWSVPVAKEETSATTVQQASGLATDPNPFSKSISERNDELNSFQQRIHDTVFSRLPQPWVSMPKPQTYLRSDARWDIYPSLNLSAIYGQHLFAGPSPSLTTSTSPSELLAALKNNPTAVHTELYKSLPGIPKAFLDTTFITPYWMMLRNLEYVFVPSPNQVNRIPRHLHYPTLKMRFTIRGGQARLRDVSLSFGDMYHNVLLPSQVSDIQFRSSLRAKLSGALKDQNIANFVERVLSDISDGGGRLGAGVPASLNVEIPRWSITPSRNVAGAPSTQAAVEPNNPVESEGEGKEERNNDEKQADDGVNDSFPGKAPTRTCTYLFAGITHTQHFTTSFDGLAVSYAIASAGRAGGGAGGIGRLSLFYNSEEAKKAAKEKDVDNDGGEDLMELSRNPEHKPTEWLNSRSFVNSSFRLLDVLGRAAGNRDPLVAFKKEKEEVGEQQKERGEVERVKKETRKVEPAQKMEKKEDAKKNTKRKWEFKPLKEDAPMEEVEMRVGRIERVVRGLGQQVWGKKEFKMKSESKKGEKDGDGVAAGAAEAVEAAAERVADAEDIADAPIEPEAQLEAPQAKDAVPTPPAEMTLEKENLDDPALSFMSDESAPSTEPRVGESAAEKIEEQPEVEPKDAKTEAESKEEPKEESDAERTETEKPQEERKELSGLEALLARLRNENKI